MIKIGLIDKWNKFALKKIKINDRIEISVGRLIFGTIMFLITIFTNVEISWVFLFFGVKIKKNHKNGSEENKGNT